MDQRCEACPSIAPAAPAPRPSARSETSTRRRGDVEAVGLEPVGLGAELALVEVGHDEPSAVAEAAGARHAHAPDPGDDDDLAHDAPPRGRSARCTLRNQDGPCLATWPVASGDASITVPTRSDPHRRGHPGPGRPGRVVPASGAATSEGRHRVHRALDAFVRRADASPGISVVVQRDAMPVLHAAGLADTATEAPIRIDDSMRLASVAKAFSGAAALALVADGNLKLDDTVGESCPISRPRGRRSRSGSCCSTRAASPTSASSEGSRKRSAPRSTRPQPAETAVVRRQGAAEVPRRARSTSTPTPTTSSSG